MPKPQQEPHEGYVAVGRVLRPWGLRGDLKVESLSDFPERFDPGARVWLDGVRREIEQARSQTGYLYLKLSGIDDVTAAEQYREQLLEVPESALAPLDPDEFYHHQLIGLHVVTVDDQALGDVKEVLSTGGNAVLVVRCDGPDVLLPFIEDVIKSVDLAAGRITVELLEGLLPEPKRQRARPQARWQRRRAARRLGSDGFL